MIKQIATLLSLVALIALPACCWNCKNKKTKTDDIKKEVVVEGEVTEVETTSASKF